MAGIGFAGQGYTWNKDNLAQKNRRAGYERRAQNYSERQSTLRCKQPTAKELAAFRQQLYDKQRKQRYQERIVWLIFGLLSSAALGWFFVSLVS